MWSSKAVNFNEHVDTLRNKIDRFRSYFKRIITGFTLYLYLNVLIID